MVFPFSYRWRTIYVIAGGLFSPSVMAINEFAEHNYPIVDSVIYYLTVDAEHDITSRCEVTAKNRLDRWHSSFKYTKTTYLLFNDHFFWGDNYYQLGNFYRYKKCNDIARSLYEQAHKSAVISENEQLIKDIVFSIKEME